MPMNLKAVAGAIRSKKTPLHLKQGLIKKYGSQLKKEFGDSLHEVLENPKKKSMPKYIPTLRDRVFKLNGGSAMKIFDDSNPKFIGFEVMLSRVASVKRHMPYAQYLGSGLFKIERDYLANPLAKRETSAMHKKVKRCVKKVAKKGVKSPYAVCKASVYSGKTKSITQLKKNPAGNWYNVEATWKGQMNYLTTLSLTKEKAYGNFMKQMADKLNLSVSFVAARYKSGQEKIEIFLKPKSNPGAAWHERELTKSLKQDEKEYDTSSTFRKGQYSGEQIAHRKSIEVSKELSINPPKGAVKIYDKIEEIKAQKGKDSLWPKEHFKHSFKGKSEGAIYGLPDGSLLIKGNKPLWKNFDYPERA